MSHVRRVLFLLGLVVVFALPSQAFGLSRISHVVVVLMENHGYGQIIGSSQAPYQNQLASTYGLATNYFAIEHPSLPNYIDLTSGGNQGVTDDNDPASNPVSAPSIFSQLPGGASRSLEESMPSNCRKSDYGEYVVHHNPMAYYTNLGTGCANYDVPLSATPNLAAKYTFVTPNLIDDSHDGTIADGDSFLKGFVPKLQATSQYQAGTTAIFVVYDEDQDTGGTNQVYSVVISPYTSHVSVGTRFNHFSLLRTAEDLLGLPCLGAACSAAPMETAFHLTTTTVSPPTNTTPPTVSGGTYQGAILTTSNGVWTNSPTSFSYRWERCSTTCSFITGATSRSYTTVAADVGDTIRSRVTATNTAGSGNATSTAHGPITTVTSTTNLALHAPTTASSVEPPPNSAGCCAAANATDGSLNTRWASATSDPQWLRVDLGISRKIQRVQINWETAYAKAFKIQVSTDNVNWTTIFSTTTGTGGVQNLTGLSGTGRYLRMYGTARGTVYGYSIYELAVYDGTVGSGSGACGQAPPGATASFGTDNFTREGWDTFTKDAAVGSFASDGTGVQYVGDRGLGWNEYGDGWATSSGGVYEPSQVQSVHNGVLDWYLRQGMSANPSPLPGGSRYQTFGAYSFCERIAPDSGQTMTDHQAILLWPENEANWQYAESDYPEGNLNDNSFTAFAHFGGSGSQDAFDTPTLDTSQWHVYAQTWTATHRCYFVDGSQIGCSTSQIYASPERWQLQVEAGGSGTGHVYVDWVWVGA